MEKNEREQNSGFDMERYVHAIEAAIEKAPLRKNDCIEISDIWAITSLPMDLITECVKSPDLKVPPTVGKVVNRGRVIFKNPDYSKKTKDTAEPQKQPKESKHSKEHRQSRHGRKPRQEKKEGS